MATDAKNQQDIKKINRSLVLKLICTEQGLSRIDISRLTGLTKMSVTNIVKQLIDEGYIKEGCFSEKQEGAGRKPIVLLPCEDSVFVVGVYISRDFVKVSLVTLSAKIIKTETSYLAENENSHSLLQKILSNVCKIINIVSVEHGSVEHCSKEKIAGIGVACIGPIDMYRGLILSPPDFYGIQNLYVKEFLENNTGLNVVVSTDTKASAIAENLYGKGKNLKNFIYVGVTHGIGSGIIVDGNLYMGEMGLSGEIGHATINFNGNVCSCGNKGCLETYASIPNIIKTAKSKISENKNTILKKIDNFGFNDIIDNMHTDTFCKSLINNMAIYLGTALVGTINTLDLSTVIIGHEGAYGGEYFAHLIENYINNRILFKNSKCVKVEISKFKDECPVIGSGALVLNKLFDSSWNL
jgi:predicted NBD/HSP70 family sugar kinase